jgi:hypothetical protein
MARPHVFNESTAAYIAGPKRTSFRSAGKLTRTHRIRAEAALGRSLPVGVDVHHHSETQLVICQDRSYHMLLESRTRVLRAGGDPNSEAICSRCLLPLPFSAFSLNKAQRSGRASVCKLCWAAYMPERGRVRYSCRRRPET